MGGRSERANQESSSKWGEELQKGVNIKIGDGEERPIKLLAGGWQDRGGQGHAEVSQQAGSV